MRTWARTRFGGMAAIWLTLLLVCAAWMSATGLGATRAAAATSPATRPASPATRPSLPATKFSSPATTRSATATAPAARTLRFDEHNFTIQAPDLPWLLQPDHKLPPGGVISYLRAWPEAGFMVISEPIGEEAALSIEELEAAVLRNARQNGAQQVHLIDRQKVRLNGLDGLQLDLHARVAGQTLSYRFWVYSGRGFMYQLIGFGAVRHEARMRELIAPLTESFRQIDPARVAHALGMRPFKGFRSERFGYTIDLKDPRWRQWADLSQDLPEAEAGALRGAEGCMAVIPVAFLVDTPEIEALAPVLLSLMNVEWEKVSGLRRIKDGAMEGYTCDYARVVDGSRYRYRFKILRGDGFGYLVAAWTSDEALVGQMSEWVDSVKRARADAVAVKPDALTPDERRRHAIILREIGLHYYYKAAYDRAARYFQVATPLAPEDEVLRGNEVQCFIMQEAYEKAIATARKHLERLPDSPLLLCKLGLALGSTGKLDEAFEVYRRAFEDDYENAFQFESYIGLLMDSDKLDEALSAVERYRKRVGDPSLLLLHARILAGLERHDEAIDLLKRRQEEIGLNAEVTSALAERYNDAGRHNEGLEVARELLAAGFDTAYTHFLHGRAQTGLKWYREAKASLETALKKESDFPRAEELLRHVSGMLGQGDSAAVRTPIEPVAFPAELLKDIGPATQPSALREQPAVYRLRLRAFWFERGKQIRETHYRRVEILNRQGVEEFSTMQIEFDPLVEQLYVNTLEVRDAAGKVVSTGNPADYYLVDEASAGGTASTARTLNIPVPGLKPGHTLEMQYTRRDRATSEHMRFDSWYFPATLPTARSVFYVGGDVDAVRWWGPRAPQPQQLERALCWSMQWPQTYRREPFQQELARYLPMVAVADKGFTWDQEAREYLDTIRELLAVEPRVEQLAQELTDGVDSPSKRLATILQHVQHEYTYKAIEFGRRARIPQHAADVLHNRYGDCKDHSLLLYQLLNASGIEARLALIRSGGTLIEDLPSLDQFDHMIVYAPGLKRFFDCTDKDGDLTAGVPYGLAGRSALVLDEKATATLITVPDYPAGSADLSSRRSLQIVGDGDLEVQETLSASGTCAAYLRSVFRGASAHERPRVLQNLLGSYADLTVRDATVQNIDQVERPFIIESKYLVRRGFVRTGSTTPRLTGSVPALWERFYFRPEHLPTRESPFAFRFPIRVRSSFALALPIGARLESPPVDGSAESRFTKAKITYRADEVELRGDSTIQLIPGEHPAWAYAEYEAASEQALSALEGRVVLETATPAATTQP